MTLATLIVLAVLAVIGASVAVAVLRHPGLIDGWRGSWRLTSNQAQAALAVFMLAQSDVVPHLQPLITGAWWPLVAAAISVVGIYLRIQAQPGVLNGGAGAAGGTAAVGPQP
ncbi:MAG: hypothetical protein QM617_04940 [Comamonas sp.]